RFLVPVVVCLVGCGGGATTARAPAADTPRLLPTVVAQSWYRAAASCAQGPFEIEVPVAGERWGEEVELHLHTPRAVALQAVILVDGAEVARTGGVFDARGETRG